MSSLGQALRLQSTIVHALVMRNMQSSHSKSRLGIVLIVLESVTMVLTIFAMRYYLSGSGAIFGIPLALFVTTGYMPYHFHRLTVTDLAGATRKKTPTLMFPMVTSLDGVIARAINSFVIYCLGFTLAITIVMSLYGGTLPNNALLACSAMCMILWYSMTLGIIFGVLGRLFPIVDLILGPLLRVSILVSGAFYLAVELPPQFLKYAVWNPVFNGIEMMREAWIEGYISPVADPSYMLVSCLVLSVIAVALERRTRQFKFT